MALLLEEPDELSKYVDAFSPQAWRMVWLRVQLLLPVALYSLLYVWEIVFLAAWGDDDKTSATLWRLIIVSAVVSFPGCWLIVAPLRFRKGAKPKIEITPEGIRASSLKFAMVPWERVMFLAIKEMNGAPGLVTLRVQYSTKPLISFLQKPIFIQLGNKVPGNRRAGQWLQLPLADPRQVEPLRGELQRLRQAGKPVPILNEQRIPPFQIRWFYLVFLGLFLMLHGGPLLMIGLLPPTQSDSPLSQREQRMSEKLRPILTKHFHSRDELRRFYVKTGAVLLGAGATMCAAGFIIPARQRKAWQLAAASERPGGSGSSP